MTIWDTGTYETEKWNAREVIVRLRGERASGPVRVHPHRPGGGRDGGKDNWLLRRSDRDAGRDPLPHETRPMLATPGPLPDATASGGCRSGSAAGA